MPPTVLGSFVATLLFECSDRVHGSGPITLYHVLASTFLFECPGISKAHLVCFRRRLWPRQETLAQLEHYCRVLGQLDGSLSLGRMDPSALPAGFLCF